MTVKELIDKLTVLPLDKEVKIEREEEFQYGSGTWSSKTVTHDLGNSILEYDNYVALYEEV